jgi:hypothetical protein
MSNIAEKTYENIPFLERYFTSHREQSLARSIGRICTYEIAGIDKRFDVEIASGFSEALNGRVSTEYEFGVVDGNMVADDGETFQSMMLRARRDAYELAANDPEMSFVCDRFEVELAELNDQQSMARGEVAHNTIITFSPITVEKIDKPHLLKRGYQRPDLVRSMVRLSFWDGTKMHILTRSLDHSSMKLLKHAAHGIGYNFSADSSIEMLAERIHTSTNLDDARAILDTICASFDQGLEAETGIASHQGAVAPNNVDLIAFIQSHPKILEDVQIQAESFAAHCRSYEEFERQLNSCLYSHLALYDEMLKGDCDISGSIGDSADRAAVRVSERGTEYSLCGFVITSGLTASLVSQTGFLSLTSSTLGAQRTEIVAKLMKEKRKGECMACGAEGSVFGCGLCARCNKVWSDEFKVTGRGLEINVLAKRFFSDRKKNSALKIATKVRRSVKEERRVKSLWN